VLVHPHHSVVDDVQAPVEPPLALDLALQSHESSIPGPGPLPAVEAAGNRLPRAEALGQAVPGAPGAQHPEQTVADGTMVVGGAARAGLLGREQWARPLPLRVRQFVLCHTRKRRPSERLRTRPKRFNKSSGPVHGVTQLPISKWKRHQQHAHPGPGLLLFCLEPVSKWVANQRHSCN
jgi:hypothetical protein